MPTPAPQIVMAMEHLAQLDDVMERIWEWATDGRQTDIEADLRCACFHALACGELIKHYQSKKVGDNA